MEIFPSGSFIPKLPLIYLTQSRSFVIFALISFKKGPMEEKWESGISLSQSLTSI